MAKASKKEEPKPLIGLDLLRKDFEPHQISKLPKPTKKQTDDLKRAMDRKDFSLGIRCKECGGWHHKDVVHLDYVGHAALTDRLLDCDPSWNYDFLSTDDVGMPIFDRNGGMWIKLTVCGVTRLGYGDAPGKKDGNAIKEVIGDALRNAAMRFGAALNLWHKGELHVHDNGEETGVRNIENNDQQGNGTQPDPADLTKRLLKTISDATDQADLEKRTGPRYDDALADISAHDTKLAQSVKDALEAKRAAFEASAGGNMDTDQDQGDDDDQGGNPLDDPEACVELRDKLKASVELATDAQNLDDRTGKLFMTALNDLKIADKPKSLEVRAAMKSMLEKFATNKQGIPDDFPYDQGNN